MFAGFHKQSTLPTMIITQQNWPIFSHINLLRMPSHFLSLRGAYVYPRIVWQLPKGKQTGERDKGRENDTLIC